MAENNRQQRICKTCNRPFSISDNELAWLETRGLKPFTHCSKCRAARREKARREKARREQKEQEKRNNNGK